ncbi:alpha/beta hydrolase [Nannocystis sp.]|uniref:alpha/beta fold hydrolase n=1 Tax=Nannocystis sp. TaxID=1962667 RepID=UPI0024288C0A|nr:alpha/beta hydrolase [Nannocystis sp.]MBK7823762.1 alpha/beta hydrolase [Nannocystis sp.]MBK9755717.1 alpha/beta hydrolase [Nannocystis sp.]
MNSVAAPSRDEGTVVRLRRDDGASLRLFCHGPRDAPGPAILILDGIGCAGWAFERSLPTLSERHRIVLMHYRGHGKSPDPPRPWQLNIPVLADDAAAACEHLGLRSVVLVGFSMGFPVALEVYRRHRPLVAGLLSLAGPSGRVLTSFQGTQAFGRLLPLAVAVTRIAHDLTTRVWRRLLPSQLSREISLRSGQVNADRIEAADLELYMRGIAAMNPELFVTLLDEAHRHSAADVLPTIAVPTLIVAGARDSFVPITTMRALAFAIPRVQWKVYPDATHALPAEYPLEIAREILEFVEGTVVPSLAPAQTSAA